MTIQRMIVGINGSENGEAAFRWAVEMASDLSAELVVVYAVGVAEDARQPVVIVHSG